MTEKKGGSGGTILAVIVIIVVLILGIKALSHSSQNTSNNSSNAGSSTTTSTTSSVSYNCNGQYNSVIGGASSGSMNMNCNPSDTSGQLSCTGYLPGVFRKEYYSEIVRFSSEVATLGKYLQLGTAPI